MQGLWHYFENRRSQIQILVWEVLAIWSKAKNVWTQFLQLWNENGIILNVFPGWKEKIFGGTMPQIMEFAQANRSLSAIPSHLWKSWGWHSIKKEKEEKIYVELHKLHPAKSPSFPNRGRNMTANSLQLWQLGTGKLYFFQGLLSHRIQEFWIFLDVWDFVNFPKKSHDTKVTVLSPQSLRHMSVLCPPWATLLSRAFHLFTFKMGVSPKFVLRTKYALGYSTL